MDTSSDPAFEAITAITADFFSVPICLVSLIGEDRQWFKSRVGIDSEQTPRDVAFCATAIELNATLVVPDATLDPRFSSNPFVTSAPFIRFYAGCPIRSPDGFAMGTLCIIDIRPRAFGPEQIEQLSRLALSVERHLHHHGDKLTLADNLHRQEGLKHALEQQESRLAQQNSLFEILSRRGELGIWQSHPVTGKLSWSAGMRVIYGVEPSYEPAPALIHRQFCYPEDKIEQIVTAENSHEDYSVTVPIVDGRGHSKWVRIDSRLVPGCDGQPLRIGICQDVTKSAEKEASFRLLFQANPVPMWVYDTATLRFLKVNDAAIRHYGYTRDEFLAMTILDIRPAGEHERLRERLALEFIHSHGEHEWSHVRADGSRIAVAIYSSPLDYHGLHSRIVAAVDVTERRNFERKISRLASQDPLTGLPNRRQLLSHLETCFNRPPETSAAVLILDLDNFKSINDTFGHPAGDDVIIQAVQRLQYALRPSDLLARLGGDEFAVVINDKCSPHEATAIANRLIAGCSEPFTVSERAINLGLSIGIACAPEHGSAADVLLRNADLALYRAKAAGRNCCRMFEPVMHLQQVRHTELVQDMRMAIKKSQLELHVQPIVNLASRAVVGHEALVRWRHPLRGLVAPQEFIPIAEETGLIIPLSRWVFRQACLAAASGQVTGVIAVNASAVQFSRSDIIPCVREALGESGLPPSRLEIEVTETMLLDNTAQSMRMLEELHAMGIRLALDDFGTGYSNLSYLQSMPIDKLKIDRSFVRDLCVTAKSSEIVKAAISLADSIGIMSLGEGVETEQQAAALRRLGCTDAQGYLFGKPKPLAMMVARGMAMSLSAG